MLRWSDLSDDGTITVSHALGNGGGGFCVKEPKTSSSLRRKGVFTWASLGSFGVSCAGSSAPSRDGCERHTVSY